MKNYSTMFLTTKEVLIMEDGAIKIVDPYMLEFEERYVESKRVCYSP